MEFATGWGAQRAAITALLNKNKAWHDDRAKGIGGSDANRIMAGDWAKLWLEKTGKVSPEDLSNNLAVAMGSFTEALNRYWFERVTGLEVGTKAYPVIHLDYPFMRCNLDGFIVSNARVLWEGKHVNAFSKDDEVVSKYYAQCQHSMACYSADLCYLSVFFGSNRWAYFDIDRDDEYIEELISREARFWEFVQRDIPPPDAEPAAPVAVSFDAMREVDLTSSNAWAHFAALWKENKVSASLFKQADAGLKEMVETDVKLAYGHGVQAKRSKAGAITIKETSL